MQHKNKLLLVHLISLAPQRQVISDLCHLIVINIDVGRCFLLDFSLLVSLF
jgi:hypothetical protein